MSRKLKKWNPLNWGPGPILVVDLFYIVVLVFLYISWHERWLGFAGIHNPVGDFLPVGVPWFGALGALTISLYGVVDYQSSWNRRWNLWHLTRPVVGTILGTMAFMIFLAVNKASTTDYTLGTGIRAIPYYAISFAVGYREQTFRSLITKLIDTFLTPGDTEASVSIGPSPVLFGRVKVYEFADQVITVTNTGSSPLVISGGASTPVGLLIDGSQKDQFEILKSVIEGASISAGASAAFVVRFAPTHAKEASASVTLNCNAGIYLIPLHGTGIRETSGQPISSSTDDDAWTFTL